ncbi:hypothetical protein NX02_01050 [Sphingomonas sanxanigenens DSM 19645 = NX02]|uniref:Uncharacterized protein n=1 Tax=Sphingomonas sanxanigenens DSM 19645 = NX02 TaxID=1123269 RepID=W0A4P2_9SPHN|nr:hypothetical protein NX02_01050 [Sphingomonas sanxanigenens DSM 19645 = NX02]
MRRRSTARADRARRTAPAAVDRICGFVRDCAFDGERARIALRVRVEVRIARWERRAGG